MSDNSPRVCKVFRDQDWIIIQDAKDGAFYFAVPVNVMSPWRIGDQWGEVTKPKPRKKSWF